MQPLIKNKYLARTGNVRKSGGKEDHEVRKVLQPQIWSRWMVSDRVVPETSSMDDLSWKSLSKTIILVYVQVLQYFPWKTGRFSAQYLKFFQGTIIINICNAPTSLARRGTIRTTRTMCGKGRIAREQQTQRCGGRTRKRTQSSGTDFSSHSRKGLVISTLSLPTFFLSPFLLYLKL